MAEEKKPVPKPAAKPKPKPKARAAGSSNAAVQRLLAEQLTARSNGDAAKVQAIAAQLAQLGYE